MNTKKNSNSNHKSNKAAEALEVIRRLAGETDGFRDTFSKLAGKTIKLAEPDSRTKTIRIEFTDGSVTSLYTDDDKAGAKLFDSMEELEQAIVDHDKEAKIKAKEAAIGIVAAMKEKFGITDEEIAAANAEGEVHMSDVMEMKRTPALDDLLKKMRKARLVS